MLFYVQMKWKHEGRITLEELWETACAGGS